MEDSWEDFESKYLSASDVRSKKDTYAIVGMESRDFKDRKQLFLILEKNEIKKLFGLNQTNYQVVKEQCPKSPKQLIGLVVSFDKVKTTNPRTNQEVDGLRIKFVTHEPSEVDTDDAGINEDGTI